MEVQGRSAIATRGAGGLGLMGTPLMIGALPHLKEDPVQGIVFPKRMGYPEEFALMVESVIRNSYLNGENIRLDGALRFTAK